MAASNKRFGEMAAGVTIQTVLFRETVSGSSSGVQLNPPLRKAAVSLDDTREQNTEKLTQKILDKIWIQYEYFVSLRSFFR